jgi:hypothetical protein
MQDPKKPAADAIISESMDDLSVPGVIIELDPDEAERAGAFVEDAIDEATAWDSNADR